MCTDEHDRREAKPTGNGLLGKRVMAYLLDILATSRVTD